MRALAVGATQGSLPQCLSPYLSLLQPTALQNAAIQITFRAVRVPRAAPTLNVAEPFGPGAEPSCSVPHPLVAPLSHPWGPQIRYWAISKYFEGKGERDVKEGRAGLHIFSFIETGKGIMSCSMPLPNRDRDSRNAVPHWPYHGHSSLWGHVPAAFR